MKHTARIIRINAELNKHFPTNKDAWWVNNETGADTGIVSLHQGYGGEDITPEVVAEHILSTEPSVRGVYYLSACHIYRRGAIPGSQPR